jgi:hypothetical protein
MGEVCYLHHVKVIDFLTYVFRFKKEFEDPLATPERETLQTFFWWQCGEIKGIIGHGVSLQVLIEYIRLFSWVAKHLYNVEIPEITLTHVRKVRAYARMFKLY